VRKIARFVTGDIAPFRTWAVFTINHPLGFFEGQPVVEAHMEEKTPGVKHSGRRFFK